MKTEYELRIEVLACMALSNLSGVVKNYGFRPHDIEKVLLKMVEMNKKIMVDSGLEKSNEN